MISDANRKWWVLAAMTCGLAMVFIDQTVVSVSLPSIQADLGLSSGETQWVINAYILVYASLVLAGGRFGDLYGQRRLFIGGVAVFIAGSVSSGLSPDSAWLLASRGVQGIGAALATPATMALLLGAFPREQVGRAIGILIGVATAFLSFGPLLGGVLSEINWRWIFFINVPVATAAIAIALVSAGPTRTSFGARRVDLRGLLALAGGLIALVVAIMQAHLWGWDAPATIALMAAGVVLLAGFVVLERRAARPLIDLSMFASRAFSVALALILLTEFVLIGVILEGALFVQNSLGFSPVEAGVALLPVTVPIFVLSGFAPRFAARVGIRAALLGGLALAMVAIGWVAVFAEREQYVWIGPAFLAVGIACAIVLPNANTGAMLSVPMRLRGEASGATMTMREISATLGVAVIGSVLIAAERSRAAAIRGLSDRGVEEVQGVLAGDPDALSKLRPATLDTVLSDAANAFASAYSTAMWVAAGVAGMALIVALLLFRGEVAAAAVPGDPQAAPSSPRPGPAAQEHVRGPGHGGDGGSSG